MQKEFLNAITEGFTLHEDVENEMVALKKIHTTSVDVSYSGDVLFIDGDFRNLEAKVEVGKKEIIRKVLKDNVSPKEAICALVKERICLAAHEYR